jgi:hypothetical protein
MSHLKGLVQSAPKGGLRGTVCSAWAADQRGKGIDRRHSAMVLCLRDSDCYCGLLGRRTRSVRTSIVRLPIVSIPFRSSSQTSSVGVW